MILGFVVTGTAAKDVLIRTAGPSLAAYDVSGWMPNPRMILRNAAGNVVQINDDWYSSGVEAELRAAGTRTGAFPFGSTSRDAAMLNKLPPGPYTAQVETGVLGPNDPGVVLVEVYDDTDIATSDARLVNLSTRGEVGKGDEILIAGFNLYGLATRKLLIRAVGPGLMSSGVAGVLRDPALQIYHGKTAIAENDNWSEAKNGTTIEVVGRELGAFPIERGSRDAAALVELAPGAYTVHVRGVNDTTGVALVEIYEVP